jgi:NAD-dependent SIR2 family protein deacetylase
MSALLKEFVTAHERIFVLTGAGVSTASGIPDYRDDCGEWKHQRPMEFREFAERHEARQRYWTRSFVGWQRFRQAQPNPAHRALARLEQLGRLTRTVTQNVDGLHQRAGSREVTELHGSLATVGCLGCGAVVARTSLQHQLHERNPSLAELSAQPAPDGDVYLADFDTREIDIPACVACGGILRPQVVFFGENVPADRVKACFDALANADAMLVVGSSLMVYSGFRFVRAAKHAGIPVVAINLGKTRADDLLRFKIREDCSSVLNSIL